MNRFRVTVTDPETLPAGYTQYRVVTDWEVGDAAPSRGDVFRRYTDFRWLHETLARGFPGAILPPLPEKNAVRRFHPNFVETRRRGLERFINRVAAHAELSTSAPVRAFLLADELGLSRAKEDARLARRSSASWMPQWLTGTMASLSFASGSSSSASGPAASSSRGGRTNDDVRMETEELRVRSLEERAQSAARASALLVRRHLETSSALFELGLAFTLMGQSEGGSLGAALQQLGRNADQMSSAAAEHAEKEAEQLEEPLLEHARLLDAVRFALRERSSRRLAHDYAQGDAETKRNSLATAAGLGPGHEERVAAARHASERADDLCLRAEAELRDVTDRVRRELDRVRTEKTNDMRMNLTGFVQLQVAYHKHMEERWRDMLPKLDAVKPEPASSAAGGTLRSPQGLDAGGPQQRLRTPSPTDGVPSAYAFPAPARADFAFAADDPFVDDVCDLEREGALVGV